MIVICTYEPNPTFITFLNIKHKLEQNQMKKSRLSLRLTQSFKLINQAQTNRSVSKQTHAFSKTPRFFNDKPICEKHSYAGQQMKSRRPGVGIGMGKKSDFTLDLTCSPGVSRYNIKSEMDEKGQKNKGWSMGVSRDVFKQAMQKHRIGEYINRQLCRTPSSNKYNIDLHNRKKAPTYSMRVRTKMINKTITIQAQNQNPGPADYINPEQNASCVYSISKFKTISYGTSRSHRFAGENIETPGPGAYNELSGLSGVGKYIVSAHKGGTHAKFGASKRITKFEEVQIRSRMVPGVGSYKTPSQFGQYDGNIY